MRINEENKKIYEAQFIGNGEYTLPELSWKPSIDEQTITEHESVTDADGNETWVPATPLGYRPYLESRKAGLEHILYGTNITHTFQSEEELHSVVKGSEPFALYDRISFGGSDYVIVGSNDEKWYLATVDNKLYCVDYAAAV